MPLPGIFAPERALGEPIPAYHKALGIYQIEETGKAKHDEKYYVGVSKRPWPQNKKPQYKKNKY